MAAAQAAAAQAALAAAKAELVEERKQKRVHVCTSSAECIRRRGYGRR